MCQFWDPLQTCFDSVQGFVNLVVKVIVAGLDESQPFGGESEVSRRSDVLLLVSLVEVEIVEIGSWVGSGDEDACDEKSDGCE